MAYKQRHGIIGKLLNGIICIFNSCIFNLQNKVLPKNSNLQKILNDRFILISVGFVENDLTDHAAVII